MAPATRDIWTFIPWEDFSLPAPPPSDVARGSLRRVWKSLRELFRNETNGSEPKQPGPDGSRPSRDLIQQISPDPDLRPAAQVLRETLSTWLPPAAPTPCIVPLIGPPGCDLADMLQMLGQADGFQLVPKLDATTILSTDRTDSTALPHAPTTDGNVLVIPRLEHWYLRHQDGFNLIRLLIDRLMSSGGSAVVGCDSWAWAFLQHAIGIEDVLGPPRTLAPFDAVRLENWLRSLLDFEKYEFRQQGDDKSLFPADGAEALESEAQGPPGHFKSLAAQARGNPGVALALWRAGLRNRDQDDENASRASSPAPSKSIISSVSATDLERPKLPLEKAPIYRHILHAILLHGGLSPATLNAILPFSGAHIRRCISLMRQADILVPGVDDRVRVELTAYPFVRSVLATDGFLTDAF